MSHLSNGTFLSISTHPSDAVFSILLPILLSSNTGVRDILQSTEDFDTENMVNKSNMCWIKWQLLIASLLFCVVSDIRYLAMEETKTKHVIGSLSKDLNLDSSRLRFRKARLDYQGDRRYCEVDLDSGNLFVAERIDREVLCGTTTHCLLDFEFILENPLELHSVVLEIQDINDNPPVFTKDSIKLEISEAAPIGSKLQIARARDLDVGINSVQTYILSQNKHFVVETKSNKDRYLDIVLKSSLDRETKGAHSLIMSAVDGGNPPTIDQDLLSLKCS